MKVTPIVSLLTTSTLALNSLYTNAAESRLEEIIVTSSRVEEPLRQVGTSVSVITEEEIRSFGFSSLQDVLRTQSAIGVTNRGGAGKVSTLRIRGEEGYRTKVLLDGIDITDPSSPQPSPRFEQLLSSNVSRVEILRGPQGMMYGADAGGVVNITSRAPGEGFNGDVGAEAGRYGTQQLSANLGYGSDQLGAVVSATDYETDGFNARDDDTDPGDDDGYENTTLHGRVNWRPADGLDLSLAARNVEGENQYDYCGFPPTNACSDDYELNAWRAAARFEDDSFTHELAYSASETERILYTEGAESFAYEGEIEKWSYIGDYSHSDALRLVYGIDLETESLVSGGDSESRDEDGYYLEYQGNWIDNLYVTAGARHDDNDDFGSHTSWRVSSAYLIPLGGGEIKLRGAYGTGFRAPSLYEIAYNDGPFAYPPAAGTELDAEESEGYDLAIAWSGDSGLYLEAVYFDQRIDQAIIYDPVDYSGYLQDDGESESSGVELIAEVALPAGFTLRGNYTWNETETDTGEQRAYRPEQLANIGLDWLGLNQRLHLGINARLSADAIDTDGADVDDYEVVNLYASFTVLQGLDVFARVENALDEEYQEIAPFNTARAAAYAGVRYTF